MSSVNPEFESAAGQTAQWGIRRQDGMVFDFSTSTFVADSAETPPTTPYIDLTPSPTHQALYLGTLDTTAILAQFPNVFYTFVASFNGGAYFATYSEFVKDGSDNVPPGSLNLTDDDVTSIGEAAAAGVGDTVATLTATQILDVETTGGGTIREAIRASAAGAGGNVTEPSDHSTTEVTDFKDKATVRITSVNTATTRVTTVN